MEALMELVERAINGVELPDYAGVPDAGALARHSRVSGLHSADKAEAPRPARR